MAILSGGGGNWYKFNEQQPGTVLEGNFVSFTPDAPGNFGPQSLLKLETSDGILNVPCPGALAATFKKNVVAPGTRLRISYRGKEKMKNGKLAHSFVTETIEDGDTSFPPKADAPADDADALQAKLDALKAKKDKRAA